MKFRVTLSNDVDEYYKEECPKDIQMSLTVEASSFDNAILTAKALMETYVFWPRIFEVVAVRKLDDPEEREQASRYAMYEVIRPISKEEADWLPNYIRRPGYLVYEYLGPTYGCISPSGFAVSEVPGETPFYEIPFDAVRKV